MGKGEINNIIMSEGKDDKHKSCLDCVDKAREINLEFPQSDGAINASITSQRKECWRQYLMHIRLGPYYRSIEDLIDAFTRRDGTRPQSHTIKKEWDLIHEHYEPPRKKRLRFPKKKLGLSNLSGTAVKELGKTLMERLKDALRINYVREREINELRDVLKYI